MKIVGVPGFNSNIKIAHFNADDALRELLKGLGFSEIVNIYYNVGKWYS